MNVVPLKIFEIHLLYSCFFNVAKHGKNSIFLLECNGSVAVIIIVVGALLIRANVSSSAGCVQGISLNI